MKRDTALALVQKHVKNRNLIKHMLAVEVIMEALAKHLGEDPEKWGLAGLLHDIDYDKTADSPEQHSMIGADMLAELGVAPDIVYAVRVHNEVHGLPRNTLLDKALYAADPLSGLIVAAALIHPERKLAAIDVPFLINRFHEKSFARGASREQIETCTELGLSLEEFMGLALRAMQAISTELGL
ncbi:MAG: HDIG domain-containing protein [Firmicutes bacterium]|nr:HDIG domain-containing protein [Bacillota bacterium]